MEPHLPHVHGMGVRQGELPAARGRRVAGEGDRHVVLPDALRDLLVQDRRAGSVLPDRDEAHARVGGVGVRMVHVARARQLDRGDGGRRVEDERAAQHAVPVLRRGRLRRQHRHVAALRRREREHEQVAIVAVLLGEPDLVPRQRRHGQGDRLLAGSARDLRLAVREVPHRHLGRDPGAAAHRPARAVLHLVGQTARRAAIGGVTDEVVPVRAEAGDLRRDARPGSAELAVEELDAADARGLHRVQVGVEPGLRDVAANQVEPRLGVALGGGMNERFHFESRDGTRREQNCAECLEHIGRP